MATKKAGRREQGTGTVRQLPSKMWQARWRDANGVLHPAPKQFDSKLDASAWLDAKSWLKQAAEAEAERTDPSLRSYAEAWLAGRELKPKTSAHYRRLLDQQILPGLGSLRLSQVTPATVKQWYADLDRDKPTLRAHAYALLRTIFSSAVDEDIVVKNPCRISGAGSVKRARVIEPATLPELEIMVDAMPERYMLVVLLAAWCALRAGEVTELRRRDVDLDDGVLNIRRAVVWVGGNYVVGEPKTTAGTRNVALPPHLIPLVEAHLTKHVGVGADALLFPGRDGGHLPPSTLRDMWSTAREAAGRPDLHFHGLRHTGAVLAAATGATLAELMARLGHTTPGAAMRYQHAAADRDKVLAAALSDLATNSRTRTVSGK